MLYLTLSFKGKNKDALSIESLIITLIEEEYVWLMNFPKINVALPMIILDTIKMEACRSKFSILLKIHLLPTN